MNTWSFNQTEIQGIIPTYIATFEFTGSTSLIRQVVVNSECYLVGIELTGSNAEKVKALFSEIMRNLDFDTEGVNPIRNYGAAIRILVSIIHDPHTNALRTTLDKIYGAVEAQFLPFAEIKSKVDEMVVEFGRKNGDVYLAAPIPKRAKKEMFQIEGKSGKERPKALLKEKHSMTIVHKLKWGFSLQEYRATPSNKGEIDYISVTEQDLFYPEESRLVTRTSLLVKSGKEILYSGEPYSIRSSLDPFVKKGLLAQVVLNTFLKITNKLN